MGDRRKKKLSPRGTNSEVPTAAAILHGVRGQVLRYIEQNGSASAKEIAAELSAPRSSVSEALRRLHKEGILDLVDLKRRRGAVERYYTYTNRALLIKQVEAEQLPERTIRRVAFSLVQNFVSDAKAALSMAKWLPFQRDSWWTSSSIRTDEKGLLELKRIHEGATAEVERVRAEIHARLEDDEAETVIVSTSMFLFRIPDGD